MLWMRGGIFYSSFNLDEVILFFTSRGFFPGEAPSDPSGVNSLKSIGQMLYVNRNGGSLDPGVFTFLLRIWSLVSLKTYWLRLLPLTFFSIGLVLCYKACLIIIKEEDKSLVAFLPLLFFTNTTLLDYAFTVRPYAMEFCGLCYLFYISILNYRDQHEGLGTLTYLARGLVLSFLLGGRYGLYIPVALYFAFEAFFLKSLKLKPLILMVCPILASGLIYYLLSYRYQVELLPLHYANEYFIKNLNQRQIIKMLFGIKSIFFYLSLTYVLLFKKKSWFTSTPSGRFFILTITFLVISVALDLAGVSPLYFYRRYSLALQGALGLVTILVLLDLLKNLNKIKPSRKALMFTQLSLMALFAFRVLQYDFRQRSDIVPILHQLRSEAKKSDTVACDKVSFEIIKFLRFYNNYQIDWSGLPSFKNLTFDSFGNVTSANYYLTIYGATTVYKPDDVVKKAKDLKVIYKGSYQRLYANNE
jgi:hypothetical protein